MNRKLIILVLLSFVFVFAGSFIEECYPAGGTAYALFDWGTARPTKEPTPSPSPTQIPTASPVPTEEPTPVPSPTPEKPQLPSVAIPPLEYPATEAPASTPSLEDFEDEATPAPSPSPSPSPAPTEAPSKENKASWSGLVKFITIVFYVSAVATVLYALFFFIICALFGKKPSSGFDILKKKLKKKKKKKKVVAEDKKTKATQITSSPEVTAGFENEADAYFSTGATLSFQRRDDEEYHPVISVDDEIDNEVPQEEITEESADTDTASDFAIEDIPDEQPDLQATCQFNVNTPDDVAEDLQQTAEFTIETVDEESEDFYPAAEEELTTEDLPKVSSEENLFHTADFEIFTEEDLPEANLDVQPEIDETVSSYFNDDLDIFEQTLPEPPKENKILTFRRAVDLPEDDE